MEYNLIFKTKQKMTSKCYQHETLSQPQLDLSLAQLSPSLLTSFIKLFYPFGKWSTKKSFPSFSLSKNCGGCAGKHRPGWYQESRCTVQYCTDQLSSTAANYKAIQDIQIGTWGLCGFYKVEFLHFCRLHRLKLSRPALCYLLLIKAIKLVR